MQYPQIQFYKGSLVRLASGKLKQVEDLDSEDFLESALDDLATPYIDSSVVKDFLEVSPSQSSSSTAGSPSSSATSSPADNLFASASKSPTYNNASLTFNHNNNRSTSQQHLTSLHSPTPSQTVLIKFFLESSRQIVFIEVPIERPFFVFHRGWSSWNPQKTYEQFGLKCRKLKIGDTCISLIRTKAQQQQHCTSTANNQAQTITHMEDSDECNFLFSSIKINDH